MVLRTYDYTSISMDIGECIREIVYLPTLFSEKMKKTKSTITFSKSSLTFKAKF